MNSFNLLSFPTDLSFNNIEYVEGLDNLTKLRDLTLYNNRISELENMDSLTELHVFSAGNNKLSQLENVGFLKLSSLIKPLYNYSPKGPLFHCA